METTRGARGLEVKRRLLVVVLVVASVASFVVLAPPPWELLEGPVEEMAREKRHHLPGGIFRNPWAGGRNPWTGGRTSGATKTFFQLLKWKFSRNPWKEEKKKKVDIPVTVPDFELLEGSGKDYFVWLGHSTVYMKVGGVAIITDPVFWDVAFGIKRATLLPIDAGDLPGVDLVFISHGHYDHLDTKSVRFLKKRFDPVFVTGPGYKKYFESVGVKKRIEIDWWESFTEGGVKVTALPVQHWSKRTPFDTNTMLWSSFMVEGGGNKYYWVGDTGYFRGFKEIGRKFGPIDTLFVPIGSYEPRWFMKGHHVSPEEAMEIAGDVKARSFVPIHWGTFDLTDEPLTQPIERIREAAIKGGGPKLVSIDHGGVIIVGGGIVGGAPDTGSGSNEKD